jgi:NADH-quinone oxidoreductase subunit N
MNIDLDFSLMIPELILAGAAMLILLLDAFLRPPGPSTHEGDPRDITLGVSVLAVTVAAIWTITVLWSNGESRSSFGGLFVIDGFALFFKEVVLIGAGLSLLLSDAWLRNHRIPSAAPHCLMLISTVGMMYMISAGDLVMLFLGLEVMSIPIYCLAASLRWDDRSVEAGVKYLVLGSFATALMLFGMALIYAFQGFEGGEATMSLSAIQATIVGHEGPLPLYAFGGGLLMLVGLLFKISAVPFHMWTPDVYEGAPTPVTAFMSVAVKATAAAVILRFFGGPVLEALGLQGLLWGVAALTMIVGNVMALVQDNVKRMLAYSSIAHGGYILVGVLAASPEGQVGVLYYVLAYTVANMAAFGVLIHLSRQGHDVQTFEQLRGLGARFPILGLVMAVAMLSLIGIPPFAGFFGKFVIFKAAIGSGYVGLTVLALLTSAISVAYYLRPMIAMFMQEERGAPAPAPALQPRLALAVAIAVIATVALGVMPDRYLEWASASVLALAW